MISKETGWQCLAHGSSCCMNVSIFPAILGLSPGWLAGC